MGQEENKQQSVVEVVQRVRNASMYILSRWYIIFLAGLIAGLLGVFYAWTTKPQYIAQLTFVTESDASSQLGLYSGLAAQFGIDLGSSSNSAFEGDNLMELMKSRNLIEKTLLSPIDNNSDRLMIDDYIYNHELNKDWQKDKNLSKIKFVSNPTSDDRIRDSVLFRVYESILKGSLGIGKRDKKLNLIEISLKDENERFAKRFVELLVNNVIQYYTDYKVKKTRQNVAILQRQTDSVRSTLFGNIVQVAQMNDLNVNPIKQVVRTGTQRKQVDVQVNAAVYGELIKNLELSKITLRKETPLIQIIDSPKFPLERKKPGRLMMGLLFAIVAGILSFIYLLVRHLYKVNYSLYFKNNIANGELKSPA